MKPVTAKNDGCVDAAGVEGNWVLLFGEACLGATYVVAASVVRGWLTGQESAEAIVLPGR